MESEAASSETTEFTIPCDSQARIIALHNGKIGNDTHVLAIASLIAEEIHGEVEVVDVKFRAPILAWGLRRALRFQFVERLMQHPRVWNWFWRIAFRGAFPLGRPPKLVCGTLGRGEIPNAVLTRYWKCHSVHIGRPCRVDSGEFSMVITPQGVNPEAGEVPLPVAPTQVSSKSLDEAGERFRQEVELPNRVWAMLVGGDGGGYRWSERDWERLADGINNVAAQFNIQWVLTTSRRTGSRAEAILQSRISPNSIAHAVWYAENPQRIMSAYLGASERVFATEESISMLSEAIVSQRPVYALTPDRAPQRTKAYTFAQHQSEQRRLIRLSTQEFAAAHSVKEDVTEFQTLREQWEETVLHHIRIRCPELFTVAADQRSENETHDKPPGISSAA
ncbi:ELM1/GtrOC1 family putative glycosyltransferase [Thalassoglobus sp. JC818]|uniref:ELM1/GtrOC1 family putative glycosyltransferase n=1 Tax=Thalassoglobus sp. JC818 TaxID=3232136 RepID=UPI0034586097